MCKKSRLAYLSWTLLEAKISYYGFFYVRQQSTLTDEQYDSFSKEYLTLCRELGKKNTIIHNSFPGFEDVNLAAIEPDIKRPSVQLVVTKLMKKNAGVL